MEYVGDTGEVDPVEGESKCDSHPLPPLVCHCFPSVPREHPPAVALTVDAHTPRDSAVKLNGESDSLKPLDISDARAAGRPSRGYVSWRARDGGGGWNSAWEGLGWCDSCPRWVVTSVELTGVVFAWTGVEW